MPFKEDTQARALAALPEGFDLDPDRPRPEGSVLGAAMRLENPIVSAFTSYRVDASKPAEEGFNVFDEIQGTQYEPYIDRFTFARSREDLEGLKVQIDREMEDRRVVDSAGWWGTGAEMAAGLLSPSTFLPGGAVVNSAKGGISVGKTAMSVAGWNGVAAAIDEVSLQATQETRSGEETAFAIGGSVVLGGLLGGLTGTMSRQAQIRASKQIEALPGQITEFHEQFKSLSAAAANQEDMRLAGPIEKLNQIPVIRGLVRSDPMLRTQLSENVEVRRAAADLVETVLEYQANREGRVVAQQSVENRVKARVNDELAGSLANLNKAYADHVMDGPAGVVSRVTAPIRAQTQNLLNGAEKMSQRDFYAEVGKSLFLKDQHPNPYVARAAQQIRTQIFDKIKQDAIDVGIFDPDLKLNFGQSYGNRIYNTGKIIKERAEFKEFLSGHFMRKKREAQARLDQNSSVADAEMHLLRSKERAREAQRSLNTALGKARAKKGRAEAAVKRETAVSRAADGLRKRLNTRRQNLMQKTAKGYVPETSPKWRETDVSIDGRAQKAGDVFDAIEKRQNAARELLDCLGG